MTNTRPKSSTPSGNIDLMGWDTVFALTLDALNKSIVSQNTTPQGFDGTDLDTGANVKGSWDPWSVEGGEGNGIIMKCPVRQGTLTVDPSTISLDGGYVEVMITLAAEDSSTPLVDPAAKPGTGRTRLFKVNAKSTDQFQQPVVQSVHFTNVKGLNIYAAEAAFQAYFDNNLANFEAVFSAVCLEEEAISADKQWLFPTASLYAMASSSSTDNSQKETYFGVLSLTHPLDGSPLPQQNFDMRMFDYFKNTEVPTNSVYAMSAPLSMENIVKQSAVTCVKNATMDDFAVVNNGITVTNVNTLNWGDFQFEEDSDVTVCPVIEPGNFQLSLDGSSFHLSISQASFITPDGTCNVKITADQYFNLGATKLSDGNYYFTADPGLGTNSIRADVSATKGFEIAMIIESVALSIVFAFMGAALGEALGEAVSTTTTTATEGVIEASEESIETSISTMTEEEVIEATDNAVADATEAIATNGEKVGGKTGIFANKFKVWGGVLGGLFAIPVSLLPQIMTAIYNDEITEGQVPTIDDFAENFTGAIQWPEVTQWQVTGGTFASAFLLAGNAS